MIWVTHFLGLQAILIFIHLCTRSKRLRVLLTSVCLLWVLLKRRTELYPPRCPFAAFRIFWTAHWDRKCRFSTFQCLGWTFSFSDVLTYELRLQWLQQPTFNRHEPLKLDWKREREEERSCQHQKKGETNNRQVAKHKAVLETFLQKYISLKIMLQAHACYAHAYYAHPCYAHVS